MLVVRLHLLRDSRGAQDENWLSRCQSRSSSASNSSSWLLGGLPLARVPGDDGWCGRTGV